jgi:hypothetical protein
MCVNQISICNYILCACRAFDRKQAITCESVNKLQKVMADACAGVSSCPALVNSASIFAFLGHCSHLLSVFLNLLSLSNCQLQFGMQPNYSTF